MGGRGGGTLHAAKIGSRSLPSPTDAPIPSFFRVILPYMLQKKKLKLPLKFVKMHGPELSSTAALTLPNGRVWKVGVEKVMSGDNEEIWFGGDGWAEFVEHHAISAGFFLVFEYQLGLSAFTVNIFDFTTCSIEYPKNEQLDEDTGSPQYIVISDDDEGDRDHPSTRNKLRPRRRRASDSMTPEMEKTLECLEASGIATGALFHLRLPQIYRQCKKGIEEAIACKPEDRPCFIAVLSSHHIRGGSRTIIPTRFGREHKIERKGNRSGILEVSNGGNAGEQWSVEVALNKSGQGMFMGKGWAKFMEDNHLGEGDVCLFQLASSEEDPVKMDVSIFPAH